MYFHTCNLWFIAGLCKTFCFEGNPKLKDMGRKVPHAFLGELRRKAFLLSFLFLSLFFSPDPLKAI